MNFTRTLACALAAIAVLAGCGIQKEAADSDGESEPAAAWSVSCPEAEKTATAQGFPSEPLPCLSGDASYEVAAMHSGPKLVTLWASWCKPCRDEAPELEEFHQTLGDDITVIGVNTQDSPDRGRHFAQDFGWTFPSVIDESGAVMRSQGVAALPATILIDADGRTVKTFNKGDVTAQDLVDAAETELEVGS